jgi:long-chain acyl-CoA synthetase
LKRIALDLDGLLIDYEGFVKKYGSLYYGKKYGLDIVNPQGFDVDQVFDLENYFKSKNPTFHEEKIKTMVKESKREFWKKHMVEYCFKTPFRKGVAKTINALLSDGYETTILTARTFVDQESLYGKVMRKIVKYQFKKNGVKPEQLNFIWTTEKDDKKDITYRNYFDIVGDDRPDILQANNEITDTITINTSYNIDEDLGKTIRINGFENNEFLKAVKEIEEKNKEPLLDPKTPLTNSPSTDQRWKQFWTKGDMKWALYKHSPYERMQMATKDHPKGTFLKYGLLKDLVPKVKMHKKITNQEFNKLVDECANALRSIGIEKGDPVPFQFANTPEAKVVINALYKVKAKMVPIFGLAEKEEIITKLDTLNEKPKVYFATDICFSKIKEAMEELDIEKVICLSPGTSLPPLEKAIYPLIEKAIRKKAGTEAVTYNERYIKYTDFIKEGQGKEYEFETGFDDSYVAAQLFTGGTIKFKGVEITEGNIEAGVHNFLNNHYDFRRGDVIGDFMPLDHTFGLLIANHIASSLGVTLDVIMKLNIKQVDEVLERVNIFGGVPTLFKAIYNNPKVLKKELKDLRHVLSGGAPLRSSVREKTEDCLKKVGAPAGVNDGFGLTETSGGVIYDGLPVINHDMKIVDPKTGEELGYGDETKTKNVGVLSVKGPLIMKGYANMEKETKETLKDGWFYTNDMGYIDPAGKFHFANRYDDLIIVNGHNVYPKDIEELLDTIDEIKNNSVISKKDPKKDEVVAALIELKEGISYTAKLEAKIKERYLKLPPFARPIETIMVNNLADTRIFKPDKIKHRKVLEKTLQSRGV